MSTTKTAPDCCQFCGAGLDIKLGGKPAKGVLGDWARFTCGTFWFVGDAENERREIQEPRCATAERERMTRERDALRVHCTIADQCLDEMYGIVSRYADALDRVKRLEEERDEARNFARELRGKAHTSRPYPWLEAKEATP